MIAIGTLLGEVGAKQATACFRQVQAIHAICSSVLMVRYLIPRCGLPPVDGHIGPPTDGHGTAGGGTAGGGGGGGCNGDIFPSEQVLYLLNSEDSWGLV